MPIELFSDPVNKNPPWLNNPSKSITEPFEILFPAGVIVTEPPSETTEKRPALNCVVSLTVVSGTISVNAVPVAVT
jgi:hypothetical protein